MDLSNFKFTSKKTKEKEYKPYKSKNPGKIFKKRGLLKGLKRVGSRIKIISDNNIIQYQIETSNLGENKFNKIQPKKKLTYIGNYNNNAFFESKQGCGKLTKHELTNYLDKTVRYENKRNINNLGYEMHTEMLYFPNNLK